MIGNQKKTSQKGVSAKAKAKDPAGKAGALDPSEKMKKQHKANWENAQMIVRHATDTLKMTRVDRSLIEILKTVRHWPSQVKETGSTDFEPSFDATVISAEETTKGDETNLKVTFSYRGNTYDFLCSLTTNPAIDLSPGTITLHENGEWVIDFKILHNQSHDLYNLSELKALKVGDWIDTIKCIEKEIEAHGARRE